MKHADIARAANVNRSDVSNYLHSEQRKREYVSEAKQKRIEAVFENTIGASKAKQALKYLMCGHTLTPMQSMNFFGLHSLSQQVTKWRARGIDVRNIVPEEQKYHTHAIYSLFVDGERITGETK